MGEVLAMNVYKHVFYPIEPSLSPLNKLLKIDHILTMLSDNQLDVKKQRVEKVSPVFGIYASK